MGPREDCDLIRAVGVMEGLLRKAGLLPGPGVEITGPLASPDHVTSVRAVISAMTRVIRHAGEDLVRRRAAEGLAHFTNADGTVVLNSRFRLQAATRV